MQDYLKEEWKWMVLEDIVSVRYKISNYGRVKDIKRDAFVSPQLTGVPQYWYVNLTPPSGKRTLKRVHRLLAQTFIPNQDILPMVDHEDRNKYNNSVDNLRWVTRSQNQMNRDCTTMFKGVPLKHYCELNFESPTGAYTYLQSARNFHNLSEEDSLIRYNNYLLHGITGNTKIVVHKEEVLLPVFLSSIGMTIETYRKRSYLGLTNEEIAKGYKYLPPTKSKLSVTCYQLEGIPEGVWYYFPTKSSLADSIGMCTTSVETRTDNGCVTFKEYQDYVAQTLYTYKGVTGTLRQLAESYGLRYETVADRLSGKGWSLEKSLETKRQKIKHYTHDGVKKTKKAVLEYYFGEINTQKRNVLNSQHSKMKCDLRDFLIFKGINMDGVTLEPCI